MTTIGLYGCKQAPGVTTLALALAAVLDDDGGALLIEADAQGGDIAALVGCSPSPGLLNLAAAGRHGVAVDAGEHLQSLPAGGRVLLAPSDPMQVAAAIAALGDHLIQMTSPLASHLVVDRGRGDPAGAHEVALLVCHPTVAGVEQARVRCESFAMAGRDVVLAVSSAGPYAADEVAAALGRPVIGGVPYDPRSAAALVGAEGSRSLRRSPLLRAATSIADALRTATHERATAW